MTLLDARAETAPQRPPEPPEVSDELLTETAEAYGLELEEYERVALRGLIRETKPEHHWESGMRFDIIQAPYRREIGQKVPDRHITLNTLLRGLKASFERPDTE